MIFRFVGIYYINEQAEQKNDFLVDYVKILKLL